MHLNFAPEWFLSQTRFPPIELCTFSSVLVQVSAAFPTDVLAEAIIVEFWSLAVPEVEYPWLGPVAAKRCGYHAYLSTGKPVLNQHG